MEKLNVIQIGIRHEHALGKFTSMKKRPDLFNILGYVDERDFCKSPWLTQFFDEKHYAEYRKLTLEEALNFPGVEAVTVEVPNNDLVPVALKCMEHDLPMHMDKPAGEDLDAENLRSCGPLVLLAVVIHNVSGLAAGYFFARLLRFDRKIAVTIAIGVGMQNSGLASALSKQFFGIASALPGAIFSIWHNLSGALFAAEARRLLSKSEQHGHREPADGE